MTATRNGRQNGSMIRWGTLPENHKGWSREGSRGHRLWSAPPLLSGDGKWAGQRKVRPGLNSHAGLIVWLVCVVFAQTGEAANITVCPSGCNHSSVQAAVDAASNGDVVEISPGDFSNFTTNKTLTIVSESYVESNIRGNTTTLDGSNIITAGGDVTFRGLRLIGTKPVVADGGRVVVEYCFFDSNGSDGVSFEKDGSGIVRNSIVDGSSDDNVDIDHQTKDILIENNEFLNAGDDGIEVRQHTDTIPSRVTLTIRSNRIEGSDEDGLQMMDYGDFSNRLYIVEGNLFKDVGAAGIGIRVGSDTDASPGTPVASMPEPLYLVNNTFVNNPEAVSGGGNTIALNNIFVGNDIAFRSVDTDSVLQNNLLFNNTTDSIGSNAATGTITSDPQLDSNFEIQEGSPATGAGVANYSHTYTNMDGSTIIDVVIAVGSPPDLGWNGIGGSIGGGTISVPALSATGLRVLACSFAGAALAALRRRGSASPARTSGSTMVLAQAVDDEALARELLDVCRDRAEQEIGDA